MTHVADSTHGVNELEEPAARAARLHRQSIVWNALDSTDVEQADDQFTTQIIASGATAINHTMASTEEPLEAADRFARWLEFYRARPKHFLIARQPDDLGIAKANGRTAVFAGFQDIAALGGNLHLLRLYYELGLRFLQITYQYRNLAGDGCGERVQSGLSLFGRKIVAECNRLGIVLDLSHTGPATTLDTIRSSTAPVMITHSGSRAIVDTPRNKTDEELIALAERGGVIGIAGKSGFLRRDGLIQGSTLRDWIAHVDYVRDLIGIDHVCIGTDVGDPRKYTEERMTAFHSRFPEVAIVGDGVKVDVMHPDGLQGPGDLANITVALVERGYSDDEVTKVLGGNVTRVLGAVAEAAT